MTANPTITPIVARWTLPLGVGLGDEVLDDDEDHCAGGKRHGKGQERSEEQHCGSAQHARDGFDKTR